MCSRAVDRLVEVLHRAQVVRHGLFTLRSGSKSPVYVDLRQIPSVPEAFAVVTDLLAERVRELDVQAVAGAETAGIPLAAGIALKTGLPMVYVRKAPKEYGTRSQIEGRAPTGGRVVLVDDLITEGTSKRVFLCALEKAGLQVEEVLVVLDREQGGAETLAEQGYRLTALITLRQLLRALNARGYLDEEQLDEILAYLDDPQGWQATLGI